jgi:hypothetical protein
MSTDPKLRLIQCADDAAQDVLEVLESLTVADVPWWVAGGWAVDALVGEQTRPHDDVDVMVPVDALPTVRGVARRTRFRTSRRIRASGISHPS